MKKVKLGDLPEGKIKLNNGSFYKYKINKKQKHIARNTGKYIIVNQEFEDLKKEYKKTIYYHEKGHNFWFNRILYYCSFILAFLLVISLYFIILSLIKRDLNLFIISTISSLSSFMGSVLARYLIEIICDFNAIKNMGIKNFNEAVIGYYKKHNKKDFIEHPYWKWRKRIMEDLD